MGKKQKTENEKSLQRQMIEIVVYIYCLLILFAYPIIYRNSYSDILNFKTNFYMIATTVMIALVLILQGSAYREVRRRAGMTVEQVKSGNVNWMALFCLICMLVNTLVLLGVKNLGEVLWGTQERRFGYLALMLCIVMLLIVSEYLVYDQYLLLALIVGSCIVFLIGILNLLGFDVLHMFNGKWVYSYVTSTLGNVNTFASFLAIVVPIGMVFYCVCENWLSKCIYTLLCVVGFAAMVAGRSDSAYLGIGGAFLVCGWFMMTDFRKFRRFLQLIFLFLLSGRVMGIAYVHFVNLPNIVAGLPYYLAFTSKIWILLVLDLILIAVVWILEKKEANPIYLKWVRNGCYLLLAAVLVLVFGYALYVNSNEKMKSALLAKGGVFRYLVMDDTWGSYRGLIWRYSLEIFQKESIWRKLFGWGQGNFYYAIKQTFTETIYLGGGVLKDGHNIFLVFLINGGIVGFVSFFSIIVSAVVQFAKMEKKDDMFVALLAVLIAYLMQGIVNNPHIYTTPVLFILIGIGYSIIRNNNKTV